MHLVHVGKPTVLDQAMFLLAKVARQCWEGSRSPRRGASSCLLHQKEMGANAGSPHPFSVFRFASKHNAVEKSSLLRKNKPCCQLRRHLVCLQKRAIRFCTSPLARFLLARSASSWWSWSSRSWRGRFWRLELTQPCQPRPRCSAKRALLTPQTPD